MFFRKSSCLVFLVLLCYNASAQEENKKVTFDCEVRALLGTSVDNLDEDQTIDGPSTYGRSIRLLVTLRR